MSVGQVASAAMAKDDRVLPVSRWVAVAVIPVLLLAFAILFLVPDETGQRFAWEIRPHMTSLFIGAGYLGGAYFFARVALARRWHHVAAGFPPVTAFTWCMLLATVLHWDRFDLGHFPFQLWLGLYIVTPFLIPWLWLRNRAADPGEPAPGEPIVPPAVRWATGAAGLLLLGFAALTLLWPGLTIGIWPWKLTPLTARVLGGWFALLGVGNLAVSRDRRWSAWRIPIESIALWQFLILVAAALNVNDLASPVNWYLVGVAAALLAMIAVYVGLEARRRKAAVQPI